MFISGCAATADGRKTQGQGTAIGALAGAALGAGLGALTGRNIGQMAAAGAVAGAAAGYAWGTDVANRKAKYARAEQWLNEEIAIARKAQMDAVAYNRYLRTRISQLSKKAAAAKSAGNSAALRQVKAEIQKIKAESDSKAGSMEMASRSINEVLHDKQANAAANMSAFRSQASAFQKANAERGALMGEIASLQRSVGN
jgi:hypothetical protein